ncbi:hypothetical protein SAMN05443582_103233 [Phyllobacterium sp. OV277]|nr:hypothetical protein SAMN05443582_103233 [Phyllobacterium sp. OV277]
MISVRPSWFDKLTMREMGDEREPSSATSAIGFAATHVPHPELVEGRTIFMQRSCNAKD